MTHVDPFTPADVAAVIQAARHIGAGGVGPLPVLSEHLSKIANKIGEHMICDSRQMIVNAIAVGPEADAAFGIDRAEAEADL